MKIPHNALIAIANGERFVLMRNVGQPFEPKLEHVEDLDLLLTNFSAGVRHQDSARGRNLNTNMDELAHGAAIAEGTPETVVREPAVIESYLGVDTEV